MTPRPPPLRILFVVASLDTIGGHSIQADLLMRRLRGESSVCVRFVPINPRLPGPLRAIQKHRFIRTGPTVLAFVGKLLREIPRCDVLHVFSASYLSFVLAPTPAILLARLFGKPVLLNYHSGEAEDHLTRWRSAVPTIRLADALVVPSAYLVRVFGRFGLQATAVSNAVDLRAFVFRHRDPLQPRFLVNRNFERHYHVDAVLRAYQIIERHVKGSSLSIVGDGPERARLRALAETLELKQARFMGSVSPAQMPAVYDQHDVFLNASTIDNMPLSILEAHACGLPVVSTSGGGIPDIVQAGRSGLLVECGDVEGLAEHAVTLLDDARLARALADEGRRAAERYTWERVGPRWMDIYHKLAEKERQPGASS